MNTSLEPLGYTIPLKQLPTHFLENIRQDLTVKPLSNPNFPSNDQAFPIYRISKNNVYVPRFYGIEKFGVPKTNNLPEPFAVNLEFNGSLREIQQNAIDAILKNNNCGVISLDTGLGKTVVALKLISLLKVKTIILVHAEFLLDQWKARIEQYLPGARIGIIRQDRCEIDDIDISIGMIQTVINRTFPKEIGYGLMINDETHHICAKTFSSVFYKIQPKFLVGLSATPERKDGLSKVLHWFIGPIVITVKRDTNKPSIQFEIMDTTGYVEKFNKLGKVNSPEMITDLSKQKNRNLFIINKINELVKQDRKILVLSDRREHCELFLEQLKLLGINAGVYLGGMKTKNREESVNCPVILGTYQASGEGFDVPELDTLILATPKSDVEQAVGRILRQKNKNDPLVIDIVDSFSLFKGQYYKRRKFYKSAEFKIN